MPDAEMVAAVQGALYMAQHALSMMTEGSELYPAAKRRAEALEAAIARLEASRWRDIAEAPEHLTTMIAFTDPPALGQSRVLPLRRSDGKAWEVWLVVYGRLLGSPAKSFLGPLPDFPAPPREEAREHD